MKVNQKLLAIALIAASGVLGLPKGAIAGTSFNGVSINGLSFNGTSFNGTSFNGVALNGLRFNGANLNGVVLNGTSQGTKLEGAETGITLSSPNFDTIKVEGGRLVGVK